MSSSQVASPSPTLFSGFCPDFPPVHEGALTPDALMLYLELRLSSLDAQINAIFEKQQRIERLRASLGKIQTALAEVPENKNDLNAQQDVPEANAKIREQLVQIENMEPSVLADMERSGLFKTVTDDKLTTAEKQAISAYIDDLIKQLEADAQLNMIRLQSLMSNRGVAIQLSTNLISSLSDANKAIAANIK